MKKYLIAALILLITAASVGGVFMFKMHSEWKTVLNYADNGISQANSLVQDVYTDKSRYNPGDSAKITINLVNATKQDVTGSLFVVLKHLDQVIDKKKVGSILLKTGENRNQPVNLSLPTDDYKGYLVEVLLESRGNICGSISTAIDVSSDWTKFPRYGYLATYPRQSISITKDIIQQLNKYHINGLQFYDWQYKHHNPVAETAKSADGTWNEISNGKVYAKTVRDYISEAQSYNIACMNYNLLFGAWTDYEKDGVQREWGLFKDQNHEEQDYHPLPSSWASDKIYLFNPLNAKWQQYLINKEKEVFHAFDFDGWHIDQLGSRDTLYDYTGNMVDLTEGYAAILKKAISDLPKKKIVFNAVNQYGQQQVAENTEADFLYAEIWNTSSYSNLKMAIDEGSRLTDYRKATVLAAYMNYKKSSGLFNEPAVKLTDAVIFASGGAHFELGEKGMLSSEYFPNDKLVMGKSLTQSMRKYYDFSVAYENYLRDGCKPISCRIQMDNIKAEADPLPGSVWYFGKEKGKYEILHLINFLANTSSEWRDDDGSKEEPPLKENIALRYYTKNDFGKILLASPDNQNGGATLLSFYKGKDDQGQFVEVTVPRLKYWDMLIFCKK